MGALRREVFSPLQHWRKPHTLAALFFSSLLFATSLDALLLSYRLRYAELEADMHYVRQVPARVITASEIAEADRLVERAIETQHAATPPGQPSIITHCPELE